MGTDHNGKEIKPVVGQNVRISTNVYDKARRFAWKKGYRIGKFFESAVLERMEREVAADRETKRQLKNQSA